MDIKDKNFFCSWSGGKDSCLSLYYAIRLGGIPKKLLTMVENNERSRSHGLSLELLKKQSELMKIPLVTYATSWDDYEGTFTSALKQLKTEGVDFGIYGDIDLEAHRQWVIRVSAEAGINAFLPIWQKSRRAVVEEFLAAGFKALIVVINEKLCDKAFLGRTLDYQLIRELEEAGVDAAGENGEFHTAVIAGPIFTKGIAITLSERRYDNGYWFQPISLA